MKKTDDRDKLIEILEKKLKEKEDELNILYESMERLNSYVENIIEDTEKGIRAAMALHRKFASKKFPDFSDITFASKYIVSTSNRSSYFDIFELPDDIGVGLILCDSEGYGISAMLMSIIVSLLETPLVKSPEAFVETILKDAKQFIRDDNGKTFKYNNEGISLTYLVIDRNALELKCKFVDMPGILISRDSECIKLDASNQGTIKLVPGDKLIIPNNGLYKSKNYKEQIFGFDNLIKVLNSSQHMPISDIIIHTGYEIDSFIDGKRSRLFGDLVLLGIEFERRMLYVV